MKSVLREIVLMIEHQCMGTSMEAVDLKLYFSEERFCLFLFELLSSELHYETVTRQMCLWIV